MMNYQPIYSTSNHQVVTTGPEPVQLAAPGTIHPLPLAMNFQTTGFYFQQPPFLNQTSAFTIPDQTKRRHFVPKIIVQPQVDGATVFYPSMALPLPNKGMNGQSNKPDTVFATKRREMVTIENSHTEKSLEAISSLNHHQNQVCPQSVTSPVSTNSNYSRDSSTRQQQLAHAFSSAEASLTKSRSDMSYDNNEVLQLGGNFVTGTTVSVKTAQFHKRVETDMRSDRSSSTTSQMEFNLSELEALVSNPHDLSQRRDVLFKTIIRDMRKFYIDHFNESTRYIRKKRYKTASYYIQEIRKYITETMGIAEEHFEGLDIFLAAMVYPKHLKQSSDGLTTIEKEQGEVATKMIHGALYSFSLTKLFKLMKVPQISSLFKFYFQTAVKSGHRIQENSTMSKHPQLYHKAFETLRIAGD